MFISIGIDLFQQKPEQMKVDFNSILKSIRLKLLILEFTSNQ